MVTTLLVPVDGAWDIADARVMLRYDAVPGTARFESTGGYTRVLSDDDGEPRPVTVHLAPTGVRVQAPGSWDGDRLAQLIRWWFDLSAPLETIEDRLGADEHLGRLVRARPGLRITRCPGDFAAVLITVIGQNVSLAAMHRFAARLIAAHGSAAGRGLHAFPSPADLAVVPVDELRATVGVTGARARTLHGVAELFAAGFRLPRRGAEAAAPLEELRALPGIGPWTIEYLRLRATDDPDALPASDAVLRRAMGGLDAGAVEDRAAAWAPYRSYATARLWSTQAPT